MSAGRTLRILQTNDFHGALDERRCAEIAPLRESADLYFDCGDCIKTGNLGVPMRPDPVWPMLASLRCSASVMGNRESHVMESAFRAKIAGLVHPLLCANLHTKENAYPLPGHLVLFSQGMRIGIVGVMVAMVTDRMASRMASAYLWDPPIECAIGLADTLRPQVDVLIALTHIGFGEDQKLAERCQAFDLILGGHSHTVLEHPVILGKTAICQTGSHGRFVGVYEWNDGKVTGSLVPLGRE